MADVCVTGATGFLGGALARQLLRAGQSVIASGRRIEALKPLEDLGAGLHIADLSQTAAPPDANCETFVHCAALSSPWGRREDFIAANIDGTRNAIALARALKARRFVHISTPSLYFRFADQEHMREDAALPKPINAYAETKAEAEQIVLDASDLDPIILRPRGLYGAGDTALLPRLLKAAAKRPLPLMRGGRAATDLTHIDDVVSAVCAAIDAPASVKHRVFNISGGVALPIQSVVNAASEKAGFTARWRTVPFGIVRTYAQLSELGCSLWP